VLISIGGVVGKFLKVFSIFAAVPIPFAFFDSSPQSQLFAFAAMSAGSAILGYTLDSDGVSPNTTEAMLATVVCWLLAVVISSVPFLSQLGAISALFESASGLTTTGMTAFSSPSSIPTSLLLWRSFIQWIGGLGVLTFFVAVLGRSGDVVRRLYSAEAGKSSATLHTSVTQSVKAALTAYSVLTGFIVVVYFVFGMNGFDALIHSFSTVSTGGFSTSSSSFSQFSDVLKTVGTFTMFFSGANMVLVYSALRGQPSNIIRSDEFLLYTKFVLAVTLALFLSGYSPLDAVFQSASIISTTGYTTVGIAGLSVAMQFIILMPLLVGGTAGSTAGGVKVLRAKIMWEIIKQKARSYYLPDSALNKPVVEGEIIDYQKVSSAVALIFLWLSSTLVLSVFTSVLEPFSLAEAASGALSALGNAGPYYGSDPTSLRPATKAMWALAMIVGRLEMLPLLTVFNIVARKN
jgi:trk system potassium uptake protein TrkH